MPSAMTRTAPGDLENHDRPGAQVFNARVSNARLRQMGFSLNTRSMLEPVAQLS